MENNLKGNKFAQIVLKLDKPQYFAGDQVSGQLYLNVIKSGYPGNLIELRVVGKEKTMWKGDKTNQHSHKRLVMDQKIKLHEFPKQQLEQGQYNFPFEFNLDQNLPGTFSETKKSRYTAQIIYKIQGLINNFKRDKKQRIQGSVELFIFEQSRIKQQPIFAKHNFQITKYCCISQGYVQLKFESQTNHYNPGNICLGEIQIDCSNCTCEIYGVRIELRKQVSIRVGKKRCFFITGVNAQEIFLNLPARARDCQIKVQLPFQNFSQKNKYKDVKSSINGRNINCSYFLALTLIDNNLNCEKEENVLLIPVNITEKCEISNEQQEYGYLINQQNILYQIQNQDDVQQNYQYPIGQFNINIDELNQQMNMYGQ